MILLTGAAGKTGKAILTALIPQGVEVRSIVRSQRQAEEIQSCGCTDVIIGDLRDTSVLHNASKGVSSIYYICPNMSPDEVEIGQNLVHLAHEFGARRFVYHSVFHPQVEAMPHHWQKLRMEEILVASGLDFTILQPCAYMQNVLANWKAIHEAGIYAVPYRPSTRISMVDLLDVAEVAGKVLTESNHSCAIYELAGPEPLSQLEIAEILSREIGIPVTASGLDRVQWADRALKSGMGERQLATLLKMFEYYEKFNLQGNANILEFLLNRTATKFVEFVRRIITGTSNENR
jgi:NAD(P)H dehydrogenase (quinone)